MYLEPKRIKYFGGKRGALGVLKTDNKLFRNMLNSSSRNHLQPTAMRIDNRISNNRYAKGVSIIICSHPRL